MYIFLVILRLVHILAGVFWVGAALMLTFFISPTVNATQDAGKRFMGHFIGKTRFNLAMWSSALLTVIAGSILYWFDSNGLRSVWMSSGPGIGYGIGAVFAFLGLIVGVLGGQIQEQGTLPSPKQATQLQKIGKALGIGGTLNATF